MKRGYTMFAGRVGELRSEPSVLCDAMFQAAHVALEHAGAGRMVWSHHGLQAAFTTALIQRRKRSPAILRNYLMSGLEIRQAADYGYTGVRLLLQGGCG